MGETVSFGMIALLAPLILLVAGAYASVGLGGGTGYLAVMALVGMPPRVLAPTALVLNIVVTGVALLRFGLAGRLRWRLLLPFLITALPAAFVGGLLSADRRVFLGVLSGALVLAGLAMLRTAARAHERDDLPRPAHLYGVALPAGVAIGVVSGFLGIGGGVFLGPLVLLLGWAGPKQVAAMNSCLILVVSAVALAAHGLRGGIQYRRRRAPRRRRARGRPRRRDAGGEEALGAAAPAAVRRDRPHRGAQGRVGRAGGLIADDGGGPLSHLLLGATRAHHRTVTLERLNRCASLQMTRCPGATWISSVMKRSWLPRGSAMRRIAPAWPSSAGDTLKTRRSPEPTDPSGMGVLPRTR